MAKQKGHRANKPNDGFGTINDDNLYRGKYRAEVYEEDAENATQDPSTNEATLEASESFVETTEPAETDYKKRYDDLKRHYDSKIDEWKVERENLVSAQEIGNQSGINRSELPKTPEELEEFKDKYPDVYAIVETVSSMQAENTVQELKSQVENLQGKEKELEVQSAYKELVASHSDFPQLKTDEKFLTWLDQQPDSISDGIYKNNMDAQWAIRVVDLYKADTGVTKSRKKSSKSDPAAIVTKVVSKNVVGEADPNKRVWKASEIGKLKPWQFEKLEAEIDAAKAEGRIDLNS